jgi:transposase
MNSESTKPLKDAKEIFHKALGLEEPWEIERYEFVLGRLHIWISYKRGSKFTCPKTQGLFNLHDTVERSWEHLEFFWQFTTEVHCKTPRVKNEAGKVLTVNVPWARKHSRFTLLFEHKFMKFAKKMAIVQAAECFNITANRAWNIFNYYVSEARATYQEEVKKETHEAVGIDETSSRKGHNYITVFLCLITHKLLYITEGKDAKTISRFKDNIDKPKEVKDISTDLSAAFISGVKKEFPDAEITFDRFHVMKLGNQALDKTRRDEQVSNPCLKKSRYVFLKNKSNLKGAEIIKFQELDLDNSNLKTAEAYRFKLSLQDIYSLPDRETFSTNLTAWINKVNNSNLDHMKSFASTVVKHFNGIVNFAKSKINNGVMESFNSKIQFIKCRARGFRKIENFINMIFFCLADLKFPFPLRS